MHVTRTPRSPQGVTGRLHLGGSAIPDENLQRWIGWLASSHFLRLTTGKAQAWAVMELIRVEMWVNDEMMGVVEDTIAHISDR